MEIKSKFGIESDAHYLWSGFEKKLESLDSAGVVPQRVEAFDVSRDGTFYTQPETLIVGTGGVATDEANPTEEGPLPRRLILQKQSSKLTHAVMTLSTFEPGNSSAQAMKDRRGSRQ